MPQRFLKPGITTSRKWDACSWQAQSFYIRLITLVDDYGRYDADFTLLKSHAFPLREDIRAPQVQKLCEELQANQLAVFYKSDEKPYVQLLNWDEQARSKPKFPPLANNCTQMFAIDNICSPPSSSSSPSPSPPSSPTALARFVAPSVDEVLLAAAKMGLPEGEARKFFAYYESNGWRVGKNPMKSWQSAMSGWKTRWEESRGNNAGTNKQSSRVITGAEQRGVGIPAVPALDLSKL